MRQETGSQPILISDINAAEIDDRGTYHLTMGVASNQLAFTVLDIKKNTYLGVRNVLLNDSKNSERISDPLKRLFSTDAVLNKRYKSVQFLVNNNKTSLVPFGLFSPKDSNASLSFSHHLMEHEHLLSDHLKLLGARNLYAIDRNLEALVKAFFPNVFIHHASSVFIESALINYGNASGSLVILSIYKDFFDILVLSSGKLVFYNQFSYSNNDEFIYFALLVVNQLKLDQEQTPVICFGAIKEESDRLKLLRNYIKNVNCGSRNANFKYNDHFSVVNPTLYHNLLSAYQCEL